MLLSPPSADSRVLRFGRPGHDHTPPDERTLGLGKTIQILHDQMPTLLTSPPPFEILSPQITLHLFPTTHPHLPAVSGRIPYTAALRTAPVAWGALPFLSRVKLEILSERLVGGTGSLGPGYSPNQTKRCSGNERLVVKWRTCGPITTDRAGKSHPKSPSGSSESEGSFTGLFIFKFDEFGRVKSHVIEHVEENGDGHEQTAKFVSVTDWLLGLGRALGAAERPGPMEGASFTRDG